MFIVMISIIEIKLIINFAPIPKINKYISPLNAKPLKTDTSRDFQNAGGRRLRLEHDCSSF